ncbi:MAG: NRDE family protein [Cyclobacteriaceae bacterium]|nr:NRDE family protein [Cyclobacteriaceae bacterium]
MCLIFLSLNSHPKYKLIVAGNRDEFYQRKTQAADFWTDQPHILGGRDLEAGGTWMGISRQGKFSLVTNYRDLRNLKTVVPSRGQLVSDFLLNGEHASEYLKSVSKRGQEYNGFNLLAGTPEELYYYSNYQEGIERVADGIHGLSNALLNTPWPKVQRGLEKFSTIIRNDQVNEEALFDLLYDDQCAPDEQLPDTGIGLERERVLSSIFIKSPGYGSRSSTVITIDQSNHVRFTERVYDTSTFEFTSRSFEFEVPCGDRR